MKDEEKKCNCGSNDECNCGGECDCGCNEEAEIITMLDPDGGEHFFASMFEFDVNGITYAVLQELLGNEGQTEEEDSEMFIAAKVVRDGQAEYGFISDENVFNEVVAELNKILELEDVDCGNSDDE